jgi:hypothetical protein
VLDPKYLTSFPIPPFPIPLLPASLAFILQLLFYIKIIALTSIKTKNILTCSASSLLKYGMIIKVNIEEWDHERT